MADKNDKDKKALQLLDEALKELIRSDLDEAKAIILDQGLDPEKEVEDGLKFIRKMEFKAQASLNEKRNKSLYDSAFAKLKTMINEGLNISGSVLQEFLQSKAPSFQYRNLNTLGDEELREILQDVDVIKLMEQLEKDEEKKK